MTPYQLRLYVEDYNERQQQLIEEKMTLVYLGAYWQRVKRMPKLKDIIKKNELKKEMTAEDMLEQVKKLNEAFGGNTIKESTN